MYSHDKHKQFESYLVSWRTTQKYWDCSRWMVGDVECRAPRRLLTAEVAFHSPLKSTKGGVFLSNQLSDPYKILTTVVRCVSSPTHFWKLAHSNEEAIIRFACFLTRESFVVVAVLIGNGRNVCTTLLRIRRLPISAVPTALSGFTCCVREALIAI